MCVEKMLLFWDYSELLHGKDVYLICLLAAKMYVNKSFLSFFKVKIYLYCFKNIVCWKLEKFVGFRVYICVYVCL